MQEPGLIEHQRIDVIVDNVAQARSDVQQAFALLQGAKERLKAVFGQDTYGAYLWDRPISDFRLDETAQQVDTYLEKRAWQYVIQQTGMQAFMTERRKQELQQQLDSKKFPHLTTANVLSTLHGFTGQIDALLTESAQEVFAWLRPAAWTTHGQLKTNKQFQVGRKVIVYGVEANYAQGYRINSHRESNFRALGNVMSLLDGQGAQHYPLDLVTQLNQALKTASSGEEVVTPYLTLKPYKNNNAHITFRRCDLVDRLNALATDGSLPGTEQAAHRQGPTP